MSLLIKEHPQFVELLQPPYVWSGNGRHVNFHQFFPNLQSAVIHPHIGCMHGASGLLEFGDNAGMMDVGVVMDGTIGEDRVLYHVKGSFAASNSNYDGVPRFGRMRNLTADVPPIPVASPDGSLSTSVNRCDISSTLAASSARSGMTSVDTVVAVEPVPEQVGSGNQITLPDSPLIFGWSIIGGGGQSRMIWSMSVRKYVLPAVAFDPNR